VHWRRIGTVDERGNGFCFLGEAIAPSGPGRGFMLATAGFYGLMGALG